MCVRIRLKSENFLDTISLRRRVYPPGVEGWSGGKADLGPVRRGKNRFGLTQVMSGEAAHQMR